MSQRTCTIEGCERKHAARGWCAMHYARWLRKGNAADRPTAIERFWTKVDRDGPIPSYRPDLGPCWIWTASLSSGYGYFRSSTGRYAHAFAYMLLIGPVPHGLELDHLCRVRHCVNPSHLEPVTHAENVRRGVGWGSALYAARTHCWHGHPYGPANTRIDRTGRRRCRICAKATNHRHYIHRRDKKT